MLYSKEFLVMKIINNKIYFSVFALFFAHALGDFAMEKESPLFPTLHWDYKNNKSILKIHEPEIWREENSYKNNKLEIEKPIFDRSAELARDNNRRFDNIVLDSVPRKNKKDNKKIKFNF